MLLCSGEELTKQTTAVILCNSTWKMISQRESYREKFCTCEAHIVSAEQNTCQTALRQQQDVMFPEVDLDTCQSCE